MNFDLNAPTGSSLPSNEDSAHTPNSHCLPGFGRCETCLDKAPARQQLDAAPDAMPGPAASRRSTLIPAAAVAVSQPLPPATPTYHFVDASPPPHVMPGVTAVNPGQSETYSLQHFFTSRIYQMGHPEPFDKLAGRFWAPLAGLFTGATACELERMTVSDVEQYDGTWALRVRAVPGDERNHGAPDERLVPVRAELVSCGFLSYAAKRKQAGHTSLFPLGWRTTSDKLGATSTGFLSSWYRRYAKAIGLAPSLRGFEELRLTFKHMCFLAGIGAGATCKLTGARHWASEAEFERQFGANRERPSAFLVYYLTRLKFVNVDVTHLYVDDPMDGVEEAFPTAAVA